MLLKVNQQSSFAMFLVAAAGIVGLLAIVYQKLKAPPPKLCGSPNGPPVTAKRVKLSDGRHIAYEELGVPKEKAKHKVIFVHGFDQCRLDRMPASQELLEELDAFYVAIDRPGYGESDPNPNQSVKSKALDIEELADKLGLGSKFYVIGFSMGGHHVWSCLKYIPHRLAGASLLGPVTNYWWKGFPRSLFEEAYKQQFVEDQWTLRVGHYLPWLTHWWMTQKLFPGSSVEADDPKLYNAHDMSLFDKFENMPHQPMVRQQGEYHCLHKDVMIGFGTWDFSPLDLKNPFPNNEGSVHLWQGVEDKFVPVLLQSYIAKKLPWIHYHEIEGAGHMFLCADNFVEAILRSLLLGEKPRNITVQ